MKFIEWLRTAKTELVTFLVMVSPLVSKYFDVDINVDTVGSYIDMLIAKIDAAWVAVSALVVTLLRVLKKQTPPDTKL